MKRAKMVAIKNLKMPKGCYVCPIKSPCLEEVYYSSTRPDSCPLIEIPNLQPTCTEVATSVIGYEVKQLDMKLNKHTYKEWTEIDG